MVSQQITLPHCNALLQVKSDGFIKNLASKSCIRFVYVRYASGLVKEGVKLLHQLVIIFIAVFCIKRNIIILLPDPPRNGKDLKLMFCMKQNVSAELEANLVNLSIRPKLILFVTALLYFSALTYFYISASKLRYEALDIQTKLYIYTWYLIEKVSKSRKHPKVC